MSLMAGAKIRFVPLRPSRDQQSTDAKFTRSSDWSWNEQELLDSFNDKTRVIIMNTPSNPTGKVFRKEELMLVADLCVKYNTICLSDEVYEHINYDQTHLRMGINWKINQTFDLT
jgi:kynurenine--oxoglutarate transaminase/cysteine-S-conjugate beta-lyase/glutamine--phenylpyruvate transaminase